MDDDDAPREVRSLRRKVQKLRSCTRDMEKELAEVQRRRHKMKKKANEESDEHRANFVRAAAALRRQADEDRAEIARMRDTVGTKEPELRQLRSSVDELERGHRERLQEIEREQAARLAPLREELALLTSTVKEVDQAGPGPR